MHKNTSPSPEQTVSDLAHLAWCALVALRLARQEGQAHSPLMTHTFLLRWLATAQKQRRFPRTVAPDIDSLLTLGRRNGQAANLLQRLEYLWESCTAPVKTQSDLFRLTYAIEALKSVGWRNISLPDSEWRTDRLINEFSHDDAVMLVRKSALHQAFAEDGSQHHPVDFLVKGCPEVFLQTMAAQQLSITYNETEHGWSIVTLTPSRKAPG